MDHIVRIKPKRIWIMRLQRYVCFNAVHINPDGSTGAYLTFNSSIDIYSFTTKRSYIIGSNIQTSVITDSTIVHSNVSVSEIKKSFVSNYNFRHRFIEGKIMNGYKKVYTYNIYE